METGSRQALKRSGGQRPATSGEMEGGGDGQRPHNSGSTYYLANGVTRVISNDGRRKLQTCAEGSGVGVTSSEFPAMEGCLEETDLVTTNDGPEFASSTGIIFNGVAESEDVVRVLWEGCYPVDGTFGCAPPAKLQ